MYKHILISTDGSPLAEDAVKHGLALAKTLNAKVAAKVAGVVYEDVSVLAEHPWAAIVETAKARGCDLIVMASHGRKGVLALVLGSETTKVLTHSTIPTLVCR